MQPLLWQLLKPWPWASLILSRAAGRGLSQLLPPGWSASDFIEQLRLLYKVVTTGGASGGQMTDSEMNEYVVDAANQVTNVSKARFADQAGSRYQ